MVPINNCKIWYFFGILNFVTATPRVTLSSWEQDGQIWVFNNVLTGILCLILLLFNYVHVQNVSEQSLKSTEMRRFISIFVNLLKRNLLAMQCLRRSIDSKKCIVRLLVNFEIEFEFWNFMRHSDTYRWYVSGCLIKNV